MYGEPIPEMFLLHLFRFLSLARKKMSGGNAWLGDRVEI